MNTDVPSRKPTFGITMDQVDEVDRLLGWIAAQGDVISTGVRDLDPHSLPALGGAIHHAANAIGEIFDQIGEQKLKDRTTPPALIATQGSLPSFDSDMHETLLQAYSISQLLNVAAHQSDGMKEARAACRLLPGLLWQVQEYIAANFDSLPKSARDE